jgi:peptidoglycan-associated lipoprotein
MSFSGFRLSSSPVIVAVLLLACVSCSSKRSGSDDSAGHIPTAEAIDALENVHFAYDSVVLDRTALAILKRNGNWLREHDSIQVELEGHCDTRGTFEYNLLLGEHRARATADALKSMGVSGERMRIVSYGEELPIDPHQTEEAWAKNRRVHFDFAPKF